MLWLLFDRKYCFHIKISTSKLECDIGFVKKCMENGNSSMQFWRKVELNRYGNCCPEMFMIVCVVLFKSIILLLRR